MVGGALVIVGAVLLVIAAWGVIVLPDPLARQHAATKAATVALATVCVGSMLLARDTAWSWRLLLILGFLFATLPLSSHLLARAAAREMELEEGRTPAPIGVRGAENEC